MYFNWNFRSSFLLHWCTYCPDLLWSQSPKFVGKVHLLPGVLFATFTCHGYIPQVSPGRKLGGCLKNWGASVMDWISSLIVQGPSLNMQLIPHCSRSQPEHAIATPISCLSWGIQIFFGECARTLLMCMRQPILSMGGMTVALCESSVSWIPQRETRYFICNLFSAFGMTLSCSCFPFSIFYLFCLCMYAMYVSIYVRMWEFVLYGDMGFYVYVNRHTLMQWFHSMILLSRFEWNFCNHVLCTSDVWKNNFWPNKAVDKVKKQRWKKMG